MPSHTVRDAFYGGIGGIPYCRTRHQNDSWKASERGLEGIPMNEPPVLLCRDSKKKGENNSMEDFRKISSTPNKIFGNAFVQRGFEMLGVGKTPNIHLTNT